MLTPAEVGKIREAYTSDSDMTRTPSIPDLVRQICGPEDEQADIRAVRRVAARENWEARRAVRSTKLSLAIERKENAMVERVSSEFVKKREELLRASLLEIEAVLPIAFTELTARILSGFIDDKALVQAIKVLTDSRTKLVETIKQDYIEPAQDSGSSQKATAAERASNLISDLGLFARVVEAIEGKLSSEQVASETHVYVTEHEKDALDVLDAEVVSEEPAR